MNVLKVDNKINYFEDAEYLSTTELDDALTDGEVEESQGKANSS
jgi:hypothetical protein